MIYDCTYIPKHIESRAFGSLLAFLLFGFLLLLFHLASSYR